MEKKARGGSRKRSYSHSPPAPRSSSISFLRLLVLFASGVITSGGEGGGGGVGSARVRRAALSQAEAVTTVASTTGDGVGGLLRIAVAAWLQARR